MSEKKFDYYIQSEKGKWEVIIGLEVHAQVLSKSKLFSSSPTKFGAEPNTQVSLVDSAFPGMLPVINQFCIEQSVKTGLGLKAKINLNSVFDRKNYFYADLPQGYQISQYKTPSRASFFPSNFCPKLIVRKLIVVILTDNSSELKGHGQRIVG